IMRGPGLIGYEPSDVRWSGDAERIYFRWKQPNDPVEKDRDTYVINRNGSGLRKLSDEEATLAPPSNGELSRDRKRIVYAHDGDLFVYDYTTDRARQITRTADTESDPHFTRGGNRVCFTRSNNLYSVSLDDGSLVQLTDIRLPGALGAAPGGPGPQGRGGQSRAAASSDSSEEKKGTESQEWLKKEQEQLLDVVREREALKKEQEELHKKENPRKPFTLQARQSIGSLQLSPDEKYVTATVVEAGDGAKNTI